MSSAKEYLQVKFLRTLEPLGSLSIDKLEELANKSQVEELPPGRVVFRQGEKDSRTTYLLSGQLELQVTGNPRTEIFKAKSSDARYPVAQEWPRPSTCRSKTNVLLLHIDSNLLEILLSNDPSGQYEVTEIGVEEDENDWMLKFLQSPAFLNLPTDNIQKLLAQLEEVAYQSGDVIIRQGESDPWYYIVKAGKCSVARRPAPNAEEIRLAILGPGDGFGEEALITHGKRNATVTAREACVLMRLNKDNFHKLLVQPLLQLIDHSSMMEKVKAGAALIDVRSNKDFSDNGIKGAVNIPLSMLRLKAKDLNATREHIVYCNDANLSSAAAFLLGQQGLHVYVLQGGLDAQQKTFSPAPLNNEPVSKPVPAPAAVSIKPAADTVPVLNTIVNDKAFDEHKRKAQEQAQLANQAESARKQAEQKSSQLREKADALRAQADRLASKTAHAQAEKEKADAEIRRIREETLKQRDQILASAKLEIEKEKERTKQTEQEVSRLKLEAEEARKRAEAELARIHREAESVNAKQSQLEDEFKRAEEEKQRAARAAEVARIMAKQEAEKVRAEADAIRQQALDEAERLRREMESRKARMEAEEANHHQAAIEEARRKAEAAITEAARAAEEARRQAELEAEAIRKQALEEAERLRMQIEREKQASAEAAARAKAEEQLRQQEFESSRQKTLADIRRQAEQEAEAIRKQAFEEAQQRALEEARRLAELEAESVRQKTFEQVQRQAMETARFEAEKAAEAIRREALEEANRLRAEMESTRQLVESEAKRAKARIEEDKARRQAEEESLTRAAEQAARRAAEEAERRRAEDARRRAEEARYLAEQEERRHAEEAQRQAQEAARRAEAEQARHREIEAERRREETRRLVEEQARRERDEDARRVQQAKKARDTMRQAADLKQRMTENNARRQQADEFITNTGTGLKLARARVHVVKDKTILEGEEDIFVFKAPSERPPTRHEAEQLIKEAETQVKAKSGSELPSFDIEYADEAPAAKEHKHDSQFSDSIISDLTNLTAHTKPDSAQDDEFAFMVPEDLNAHKKTPRRKRSLITLAASVVIMVTVSIVVITRPSYIDVDKLAGWSEETSVKEDERGLAAIRTRTAADTRSVTEDRAKNEAEEEFRQLLSKWRSTQEQDTNNAE